MGETPHVKGTEKSNLRLHLEAARNAIQDCGISPRDIDGFLPLYASGVHAEQIISNLGIKDLKYGATIHQGGASPIASIETAVLAINSGIANYVLLTVGTRGYSDQRPSKRASRNAATVPVFATVHEFEAPYGVVIPVQLYAALAQRHMHEYGTTSRQFGAIAVACRKHAILNPKAIMRTPMTIEDHQHSRLIAGPLRKLDCSLESDGAGAVIVTSSERARNLKHGPAYIMGVAQGHSEEPRSFTEQPVMSEVAGIRKAAGRAFAMAGLTPRDVDVAELYDCFTSVVLSSIEDIGFCGKGEGGAFVEGGRIELGGELPVNTHGGLLSEAHVIGINHIIEAVRQLRGGCGERQVENAEIALVSGQGYFSEGSVMLMRR